MIPRDPPPPCRMFRVPVNGDGEQAGDEMPSLAELQAFVGGYVERVRVTIANYEMHLFINEDGRALGLPTNNVASALYAATFDPETVRRLWQGDPNALSAIIIVGNVWLWHGPLPPE